mmetsp:Transcript_47680/g.136637  ORF Transcript_47680/g.136637 Transcript_47680/m.136637 type:complete len:272 (+) Transcript_47680:1389-2204(+)
MNSSEVSRKRRRPCMKSSFESAFNKFFMLPCMSSSDDAAGSSSDGSRSWVVLSVKPSTAEPNAPMASRTASTTLERRPPGLRSADDTAYRMASFTASTTLARLPPSRYHLDGFASATLGCATVTASASGPRHRTGVLRVLRTPRSPALARASGHSTSSSTPAPRAQGADEEAAPPPATAAQTEECTRAPVAEPGPDGPSPCRSRGAYPWLRIQPTSEQKAPWEASPARWHNCNTERPSQPPRSHTAPRHAIARGAGQEATADTGWIRANYA